MKIIYPKDISRIVQNKRILEKRLNVKIFIKDSEVSIDGAAVDEYIAEKVIDSLGFGFPLKFSLLIKDEENYEFEVINIKDFTKRKDLQSVRARIIGQGGRALRTLAQLTKCYFELKDNNIGIIGDVNYIKNAQDSLISLIKGTKHANVYSYLEKHQPEEIVDFDLKEPKKSKKPKKIRKTKI